MDTGGSGPGWRHSVPPTGRHSEIFSQETVPIHQGRSFSPFLHRVVRISSRVACNRKASTLWRGGALWGKLRARCDQARGLGPGRGHHHHRKLSAQHGRGGHAWEREVGELLMHRRGLGLVRGVPHLKNLLVRELEGAACVGDSRTASKKKKKPNPG